MAPGARVFRNQRNRLPHNPGVDRQDQADTFGDIEKGAGRERSAAIGPRQPEQQLVLADLVALEIEDRLAIQQETIFLHHSAEPVRLTKPP